MGNDPSSCPHRPASTEPSEIAVPSSPTESEAAATEIVQEEAQSVAPPPLEAPKSTKIALPLGGQLTYDDLLRIAARRGLRLVGILGAPDAGKTASLVSLYLLAANAKMERLKFRNSDSLFAFDQLASGTRAWDSNGKMLEQIVEHTELADPRRPGFVHLRLYSEKVSDIVDLVFPDLPGEWSDSLIDKSDHLRLGFLRSAQAIWVFVDGSALADPARRQVATGRAQNLLGRIRQFLDPAEDVPILLVLTRRDQVDSIPKDAVSRILEEATRRKLNVEVFEIASFSDGTRVEPGHGLEQLLEASIVVPPRQKMTFDNVVDASVTRQMLRFRGGL
ncbi:TRAFAC clade GTPase domain-containing protein [Sphingopyxis sp. MG]|uniref:TRAFAC clade GTPase domain-containing protein n=1 Tax=Sphingopyxis sp. MG TaxID=1866325 RepID=UPI001319E363|nr:GTPase domain-containing protein [Sphingopyxis sp. MG]